VIRVYIPALYVFFDENKDLKMTCSCDLTGKRRLVGNKVSHAKNRTKMTQNPNIQTKRIFDPETGKTVKLRLSTNAIRTLDKIGSLSKFLRKYGHRFVD